MKAIQLTKQNRNMVAQRYQIPEGDIEAELPIGYWVLAEYGAEHYEGIVSTFWFNQEFDVIGELKNGFVEVSRK